jgi:hypothetical protein
MEADFGWEFDASDAEPGGSPIRRDGLGDAEPGDSTLDALNYTNTRAFPYFVNDFDGFRSRTEIENEPEEYEDEDIERIMRNDANGEGDGSKGKYIWMGIPH